ncbi:MAG TPA: phosphotransferase [Polyangiaceae bacterium]|nr:phosphotransferase [Polyangiaceae bacterium]
MNPSGVDESIDFVEYDPQWAATSPTEVLLSGGNLTAGVVRVGDTVRRPRKASSAFVARLLRHLEAHGFAGAPRYLGEDEQDRDTLSYLPGEVPSRFRRFADHQLADFGRLLRAFHDATRGSDLCDGFPVVCHHDPGPNNVVFDGEHPTALIDFDFAASGDPLEDVAYAAWVWCISSRSDRQPASDQSRQTRLLADSYGLTAAERALLIDAILERHDRNEQFWTARQLDPTRATTSPERIAELLTWTANERAFVQAHRAEFEAALR